MRRRPGLDPGVTPRTQEVLPLIELERATGEMPPLSALLGLTSQGVPLIVDLFRPETGHVLVVGSEGTGKSTLLRTAIASICLHSSPSQVGLFAIDLTGVQLSVLEAIPHRIAASAREVDEAGQLLTWLEREVEDRLERGLHSPALVLVIDDLDWVVDPDQSQSLHSLRTILRVGNAAGVHVLAGGSRLPDSFDSEGYVLAVPEAGGWASWPGDFMFRAPGWQASAQVAFLSALDLNRLVVSLRGNVGALRGPSEPLAIRQVLELEAAE